MRGLKRKGWMRRVTRKRGKKVSFGPKNWKGENEEKKLWRKKRNCGEKIIVGTPEDGGRGGRVQPHISAFQMGRS